MSGWCPVAEVSGLIPALVIGPVAGEKGHRVSNNSGGGVEVRTVREGIVVANCIVVTDQINGVLCRDCNTGHGKVPERAIDNLESVPKTKNAVFSPQVRGIT